MGKNLFVLILLMATGAQAQAPKKRSPQTISKIELQRTIANTPLTNAKVHDSMINRARTSHLMNVAYIQYSNLWKKRPNDAYANYYRALAAYTYEWQTGYKSSGVSITGDQRSRLWEAMQSGFQQAIRLKPDFAPAQAAYGSILFNQPDDEEKGLEMMRRATRLDAKDATLWRALGENLINPYRKSYNPKEGEQALRKTVQLNPASVGAHSALIRLYTETKRFKEAQRELQIYTRLVGAKKAASTIKFFKPTIDKGLAMSKA